MPIPPSRLVLHRPDVADAADVALVHAASTAWPSASPIDVDGAARLIDDWRGAWSHDGLAPWIIRGHEHGPALGYGGARLHGSWWLLAHRLTGIDVGIAVQVGRRAIAAARRLRPDTPILLIADPTDEDSAVVADRLGLTAVAENGPGVFADRLMVGAADIARTAA